MAIAAYKDLCIDARDVGLVAAFWGELLGLDVEVRTDGVAALAPTGGDVVLWVNPVPEAKLVKNRVHLDLWVDPATDLGVRGATVEADRDGFLVCTDPEGNELCAFPPPDGVALDAPARWFGLCTDSADPARDAAWWAGVVGGEVGPGPDGVPRYLKHASGLGSVTWKFVGVDDERVVKNRWHWDVLGTVHDLVAAGATVVRPEGGDIRWTVMADPSGNEFCAFDPG
ncbi:VOC family protein [soil metagenome]